MPADPKFVSISGLSELTGIPVRSIRTLVQKRVIPVIVAGHRTHLFQPERVAKSLERLEVKAVNHNHNGR